MRRNAELYNEEGSLIVSHARILVNTLCCFISSMTSDPLAFYQEEESGEGQREVEEGESLVCPPPPPPPSTGLSVSTQETHPIFTCTHQTCTIPFSKPTPSPIYPHLKHCGPKVSDNIPLLPPPPLPPSFPLSVAVPEVEFMDNGVLPAPLSPTPHLHHSTPPLSSSSSEDDDDDGDGDGGDPTSKPPQVRCLTPTLLPCFNSFLTAVVPPRQGVTGQTANQ